MNFRAFHVSMKTLQATMTLNISARLWENGGFHRYARKRTAGMKRTTGASGIHFSQGRKIDFFGDPVPPIPFRPPDRRIPTTD